MNVSLQIPTRSKGFGTQLTIVGFHTCVDSNVAIRITSSGKRVVALLTSVRLLTNVGFHVGGQALTLSKCLSAFLAFERFFSFVGSNVICRMTAFLITQLMVESSFWLVNLGVTAQVFRFGKGFRTELALKSFVTTKEQVIEDSTLAPNDMGTETALEEILDFGFRQADDVSRASTST
ncbi:unnamed protein product, partial [Ixodes pacificus]